jgi:hypothetical protein
MKEVTCQDPTGLSAQKLTPGGAGAAKGRVNPGAFEDHPDRGGANLTAHASEFSGDAAVSPARILGSEAQDHFAQGW